MFYKLTLLTPNVVLEHDTWVLRLPAVIGRNPQHGVFVDHESISRSHCRLLLNGQGSLMVKDMDSTNGTYLREKRVGLAEIFPGDILQLGGIAFRSDYESDTDCEIPASRPEEYDLTATVPMRELTKQDYVDQNIDSKEAAWWQVWK